MGTRRAFLFDMDGLLLDTEDLHLRAFAELCTRCGMPREGRDLREWIGRGQPSLAAWIRQESGVADTVEELLAEQEARFFRLLDEVRPPPLPGVRELLDHADASGWPMALVSSSAYPLVERTMAHLLPLLERPPALDASFGAVVTGDRVENRKPHPEPYQRAAAALGVAVEDCVVFEDSPSGVRAGRAAGCRVIAVPTEHILDPASVTEHAHAHFTTLREAFAERAWLGGS